MTESLAGTLRGYVSHLLTFSWQELGNVGSTPIAREAGVRRLAVCVESGAGGRRVLSAVLPQTSPVAMSSTTVRVVIGTVSRLH